MPYTLTGSAEGPMGMHRSRDTAQPVLRPVSVLRLRPATRHCSGAQLESPGLGVQPAASHSKGARS